MYIETLSTKISGKVHKCVLLRESFRIGKKVKHRTIANLTKCSEEEITALRLALKHKKELPKIDFEKLNCHPQTVQKQGLHVGAVFALREVAKKIEITSSLGNSRQATLALWQILARIINQGSRLSAVRLASKHAVCDVLGLDSFTEDHLYSSLNWLAANQKSIETDLFSKKKSVPVHIFLYDVTSSYLEGDCNEYAEWGYNRDRKRGKKQIVIGLLTDSEGDPLSVQVFRGNTSDNKTIEEQIQKVLKQFGIKRPIFVGDRGMFKGPQIKKIGKRSSHVSALTVAQIRTLVNENVINLNMFQDEKIHTIHHKGYRYILRRNPMRQQEIEDTRSSKLQAIEDFVQEKNASLRESKAKSAKAAEKAVCAKIKKIGLSKWFSVATKKTRTLTLKIDEEALRKAKELDGCYVIRTNVKESPETTSDIIHSRYKDLAFVETAFRTMKTAHLEVRPHYVRKATSTEGHIFVVMLAYKIVRYLREAWRDIDVTVEEGIEELSSICFHMEAKNGLLGRRCIPEPRPLGQQLLDALDIKLPVSIPDRGVTVSPRKQLRRQQARKPGQPQDIVAMGSPSV